VLRAIDEPWLVAPYPSPSARPRRPRLRDNLQPAQHYFPVPVLISITDGIQDTLSWPPLEALGMRGRLAPHIPLGKTNWNRHPGLRAMGLGGWLEQEVTQFTLFPGRGAAALECRPGVDRITYGLRGMRLAMLSPDVGVVSCEVELVKDGPERKLPAISGWPPRKCPVSYNFEASS